MNKKIFTLASCAVVIAGNVFAANSYEPKTLEVFRLSDEQFNSLTIDGKADEAFWAGCKAEPCGIVLADPGQDPVNPNGYAATWKAAYDEYNMYLFVDVTDNTPAWFNGEVGTTAADNIELFFSQDERQALGQTEIRDNKGSQLRVHPNYSVANFVSGGRFAGGLITDGLLSGCEYATSTTDKGYSVEIIVPWDGVIDASVLDIAEGKEVMFDINPANVEEVGGSRVCILGWSTTDYNAWKYNNEYGTLKLMGDLNAGVSDIEIANENVPAEYFTVDGRRVADAAAPGLYIVRQGNKASKVVR